MLCAKAGLSLRDTMGAITSHRGRASAVTGLASMPQGMTLPELMAWCGHRSPKSTMHYIRLRPTELASALADQMAHMVRGPDRPRSRAQRRGPRQRAVEVLRPWSLLLHQRVLEHLSAPHGLREMFVQPA